MEEFDKLIEMQGQLIEAIKKTLEILEDVKKRVIKLEDEYNSNIRS